AIDRVKQIHKKLPNTHLVMHGSSSVPKEWLDVINEYGGDIAETYGVPVAEIQLGIKHGVRKINIDTDLRLAATGALRKYLAINKKEFDPRKYNAEAMLAMQKICEARYEEFATAGQASKIKPLMIEQMANKYANGELEQKIAMHA
ncbi:MAG TPA: class II fructose-bisphosphate aldolase, partial [Gammaproteobacteria bacterium]|nr:class II fructose-bisphosphate aldolase [Gammaproteobacteria bacterium]